MDKGEIVVRGRRKQIRKGELEGGSRREGTSGSGTEVDKIGELQTMQER